MLFLPLTAKKNCVRFQNADKEAKKIQRFEEAFQKAQDEKIEIAYSNEVFELWLLLHLEDVTPDTPIPRKTIYNELGPAVRSKGGKAYEDFVYEHENNNDIIGVIKKIGNEQKAIQRAKDLVKSHGAKPPIETNPSTKVHLLVKELRDWITYYSYDSKK